jgi:hypothetical protein
MKLSRRWIVAGFAVGMMAVVAGSGCKKNTSNSLPASGEVSGWDKSSDTRVFAARDLWQYIDGDSEQYIQAGVVSTSTSDYKYQGKLEAGVDVYTMKSSDGARAILDKGRTKDAQIVQLGDGGLQFAQSVTFRKGDSLVRIVSYETAPGSSEALIALAHGVEAKL